jgi:hypothetical protein
MSNSFLDLQEILPNLPKDYLQEFHKNWDNNEAAIESLLILQDKYTSIKDNYKIFECIFPQCILSTCPFYHNISDRRRDPNKFFYECKPCHIYSKGNIWSYSAKCFKADTCRFCHSNNELQYHPDSRQVEENSEVKVVKVRDSSNVLQKCEEIIFLREELLGVEKENYLKKAELDKIEEEVNEFKRISMCFCCGMNVYIFFLPCGHLCCQDCRDDIKESCPRCQKGLDINKIVRIGSH